MKGHKRHVFLWRFLHVLAPFFRRKMRYEYKKETLSAPTIILANHTTNFDPILVALSYMQQMYFVASEHTFRIPVASRLLKWVFAPIARVKGKTDARTGIEVIRAVRGGYNVCIFAEGNRTYDGVTGLILPSTGKLAKASGADLVTYRIEGGYFTTPRWGKNARKGKMRGEVVGHYTAAQLRDMDADQVNEIINRDLHEDAYARQAENPVAFKGKALAEQLELAVYVCPKCKQIGTLHSHGEQVHCNCGMTAKYTEYGYLESEDFDFTTITQWDAWQQEEIARRVQTAAPEEVLTQDADQELYAVKPLKSSHLVGTGLLSIGKSGLHCAGQTFAIKELSDLAIVGRQTLTFSTTNGAHHEIKCKAPRCALKYQQIYMALQNNLS